MNTNFKVVLTNQLELQNQMLQYLNRSYIYTNATNNIVRRGILTFEISDHMPIFCTLSLSSANNTQKTLIRDMKKFNKESFLHEINDLATETNNFIQCVENFELDETIEKFLNNLTQIFNRHAPIRMQTR